MAEFGRRIIKPGEKSNSAAEDHESRNKPRARSWLVLLRISIFALFCGVSVLALFNQAAVRILKNGLAGQSHKKIMAAYRNDGMYTGLPVQTGFVSFLDNSGEHPEEKRRAEKLANDAVKRCHAALKKDIARRKRHGADERDGGSDGAFEPLLDDLGFYLPCIMTVNRRRFCSPNQRKELVRRVEAYFNVLHAARNAAPRRAPRVSPSGLNYVFFKLAEDMGGDDYRINYTPNMALLSPDLRLLAALQDLIALGYLDLEDFAAFFGLFVSVDIRPLFDTVKRQENSCGR